MSFKYLSTVSFTPTRNINRIILMFSLTNHLEITINGETKDLDNHIAIINQADIFYVNQSSNLVMLSIPVFYFYSEDENFFKCYFDRHLLQSSGFVKILFYNQFIII